MFELATYDQFARGAAHLAARLERAALAPSPRVKAEEGREEHVKKFPPPPPPKTQPPPPPPTTPPPPPTTTTTANEAEEAAAAPALWRWLERRAPVTGEPVGVLELERWVPARAPPPPPPADPYDIDWQCLPGGSAATAAADDEEEDAAVVVRAAAAAGAGAAGRGGGDSKTPMQGHHRYVFHVAYSRTYRAPVLCFSATRPDGSPLGPEQVQLDLSPSLQRHAPPPSSCLADGGDDEQACGGGGGGGAGAEPPFPAAWEYYLSRSEHPGGLPGAPASCFFLHPCRTAERMALLMAPAVKKGEEDEDGGKGAGRPPRSNVGAEAASRYLAAWLSAVAPAVGLPRPPQPEEGPGPKRDADAPA